MQNPTDTPPLGRESVWDYPRPPRVEPERRPVTILLDGATIASSTSALRVLETSHPPCIYLPMGDVTEGLLVASSLTSVCEWKGTARYWDLHTDTTKIRSAAWSYPNPRSGYESLVGYVSFYPAKMDACYLGGEQVTPQAGGFYGGWITSEIVGPFKGGRGTAGW